MNIYLDIETIPTQSESVRAEIAASITPPASMSKQETIAKWEAEKKPEAVKDAIAKTSFDGALGEICCIGVAVEDEDPITFDRSGVLSENGVIIAALSHINGNQPRTVTIVGHNVVNFDIRFLWKRAIILGIKMPGWFPRDPKPWDISVFDTMVAFAGVRDTIGLDRLCHALGIPGKGDMDGSKVAGLWERGEYQIIADYCRDDVERVRAVHKRMQLAFGEAA